MPELHNHESLSFADALFLYLEREGMPLNVAAVATFEGIVPLKLFMDMIESKLPVLPRYRQCAVMAPFNIGLPTWEYDQNFDIRNHVREVEMKHGTEAELKELAGKILSENMDRSRPLWDVTLIRGLAGKRTTLIIRMHHCLADGVSGVSLLNVLMSPTPEVPKFPKKKARFVPPPPRDSASSLIEGLMTSCLSASQAVLTAQSQLIRVLQQATATGAKPRPEIAEPAQGEQAIPSFADLNRLAAELGSPAQRLPFNRVCRGPQNFNWAEISIPHINAIKEACGAKLNDVVLTVVTLAISKYAESHGVDTRGRQLRIVVPVNIRGNQGTEGMGNCITFLPVSIPMDISDPRKLLAAVHERTMFLKTARVAEAVGLAGTLLATIPGSMQALVGPIASQLPISICNLICTNVPGPRVPLYLVGHKMLSCYPYVPIGGEMGMNCAVLTYNDVAYFGFTGDVGAIPDLKQLDKLLEEGFERLKKAVHAPMPKPKREAKPKAARRKPARRAKAAEAKIAAEPVAEEPVIVDEPPILTAEPLIVNDAPVDVAPEPPMEMSVEESSSMAHIIDEAPAEQTEVAEVEPKVMAAFARA